MSGGTPQIGMEGFDTSQALWGILNSPGGQYGISKIPGVGTGLDIYQGLDQSSQAIFDAMYGNITDQEALASFTSGLSKPLPGSSELEYFGTSYPEMLGLTGDPGIPTFWPGTNVPWTPPVPEGEGGLHGQTFIGPADPNTTFEVPPSPVDNPSVNWFW